MAVAATAYGPPLRSQGLGDFLAQRGAQIIGLAPGRYTHYFEDFVSNNSALASLLGNVTNATAGGAGVISFTTGPSGGVFRYDCGAAVNGIQDASCNCNSTGLSKTGKWYIAGRFSIPSTPNNTGAVYFGLYGFNSTGSIMLGQFGASSTTLYKLQFDGAFTGSFANTGVTIDTSNHIGEMFCMGDSIVHVRLGATSGILDFAATDTVTATLTAGTTDADNWTPRWGARAGANGLTQKNDIDWVVAVFPRT